MPGVYKAADRPLTFPPRPSQFYPLSSYPLSPFPYALSPYPLLTSEHGH